MSMFRTIVLLISFSLISMGTKAEVTVTDSWIRAVPAMMKMSAAYLKLTNDTQTDILLTGARVDFSKKTEIHDHVMSNGLMSMVHAELPILIKSGSSLEFKPKGLHIMFIGLETTLIPGAEHEIELLFDTHAPIRFSTQVAGN